MDRGSPRPGRQHRQHHTTRCRGLATVPRTMTASGLPCQTRHNVARQGHVGALQPNAVRLPLPQYTVNGRHAWYTCTGLGSGRRPEL